MSSSVTVVVTACGRSDQLLRTLDACLEQAREVDGEVLLAINAGQQELPEDDVRELREHADRLLFEPVPGKSRALNAAVRAAEGEVMAFIDDDAEPDHGWLAALTAPLLERGSPHAGAGGVVLPVFPSGGPAAWYRQILARTRSCFLGPYHFLGNEYQDYILPKAGEFSPLPFGANCAYRRASLLERPYPLELGPNRRTGGRGGEDTAVAMELLRSGQRLLHVPAARVYHPVDPERLTLEYVREGYRQQAREILELHRLLEIPDPIPWKLRRALRRRRRRASEPWAPEDSRIRRGMHVVMLETMLELLTR